MRARAYVAAWIVGVTIGGVAAPVLAQRPLRASLTLANEPADDGCVEVAALGAAVDERLGRPVFAPGAGAVDVQVSATLERRGRGHRVELVFSTATGEHLGTRDVRTRRRDCPQLADALALVLALMVDLHADTLVVELPEPPPPPTPPPPSPPASRVGPPPAPLGRRAPRDEGLRLRVGAGPLVTLGAMPHPALHLATHAALRTEGIVLAVGVDATLPQAEPDTRRGVLVAVARAHLVAGPVLTLSESAELFLLAGLRSGAVLAAGGEELSDNGVRARPLLGGVFAPRLALRVTPSLRIDVAPVLDVAALRYRFFVRDPAGAPVVRWSTPWVSGGLGLELVVEGP